MIEVTDCPKVYPVVEYLAYCKDMCNELGVSDKIDVSLVYMVRAPGCSGVQCCIGLFAFGGVVSGGQCFLGQSQG